MFGMKTDFALYGTAVQFLVAICIAGLLKKALHGSFPCSADVFVLESLQGSTHS